jgi:radical SAM superfamily enzyme YgiQ (UPF0313 family)
MKTLLVNPAFPQTFWSLDRVRKTLNKGSIHPPLGLLTLAALLPTDWDLKLADRSFQRISESDWQDCDLVLVTGMMVQHRGIVRTVREAATRGKTVVVGGPWAYHFPEEVLRAGADLVVRGEGETTVPQLIEALRRGRTGMIIEADHMADLTQSPPPRYDLIDPGRYTDMSVQFSRGCPFACEFCDVTLMLGRKVRTKTPVQVLAELEALYRMGWRGAVFFVDDNFLGNLSKTRALLEALIPWMEAHRYPFDFYTQASMNLARHGDLMDLMLRAGFYSVFLGVETTDVDSLRRSGKIQNVTIDLGEACEKINRAGLQIIAGCILGFDHERPGADQRLIDFAARQHIPEMFITLLQAGPGTALWKRLQEEDRLLPLDDEVLQDYSNQTGLCNFKPTRPISEIVEEFIHLYDVLYDPAFFLKRTFKHFDRMDPPSIKKPFRPPSRTEIRALLLSFFRQGVLNSHRFAFLAFVFKALFRFPGRMPAFIATCMRGEHFFEYRKTIATKLRRHLQNKAAPPE